MIPRIKGHMQFRSATARTTFETALVPFVGRESFRAMVERLENLPPDPDYLLRNALVLDVAFRDTAATEAVWLLVQGASNLVWAFVTAHACAVDGERTSERSFRKFEFGSR